VSTYADAALREAAWLNAVDVLPSLSVANGGPFEVVEAFPRHQARARTELYVFREGFMEDRESTGRKLWTHHLVAAIRWPVTGRSDNAVAALTNLDAAIDSVLQRVRGFPADKTHGGRWLQAGEHVEVRYPDPETALDGTSEGTQVVTIHYQADEEVSA
jgi:hypothetical protein